jgi:adenylate cyclase, class 1
LADFRAIKTRFLAFNHDRLNRMREILRSQQRDIIDLLPLLFHVNHRELPGFVSDSAPVGVPDYAPGNRLLDMARKLAPGFDYRRRALPRYDIHSLFLMGSSGTIACSTESDFDIWVCHDPALSVVQIAELQQKARAIEKWTASYGLEVHFFLMNTEQFREGRVIELSAESSGSAQHHLLLDEFYRTGLLIAGRYPVWWLVPPDEEAGYEDFISRLVRDGVVRDNETIDFGVLPRAPAEEFFGGALWQLYKSIDSPYKAALKLMLMEAYAAEYPEVDLLSMQFKRAIHAGNIDPARLDPYVMLCTRLEGYLRDQNDDGRLALMRRCFYYKVNERLGDPDTIRNASWRRAAMTELARSWGWTREYMKQLDSRRRWKIDEVLEERKSLVSALTQSYHSLSRFARVQNMLARINQSDLNILGRKLYATFERKAGKIDIINRGISDNIRESQVSINQLGGGKHAGWELYRGKVQPEDINDSRPIKRSRSLLELLVWAWLNQLINEQTGITLYMRDSVLTMNEIRLIVKSLDQIFPGSHLAPSTFEELSQSPRLADFNVFVNIGVRPDTVRLREGKHLTSNKTDALSYGGVCENQVLKLEQLVRTSWQEVLTYPFIGEEGLFECLAAYLRWSPPSSGLMPARVKAWCFSSPQCMSVIRRIEELFTDIVDCYYRNNPYYRTTRYILLVGQKYHVLSLDGDNLVHKRIDSYNELIQYLSRPLEAFSPVHIDRNALGRDILPMIYHNNRPGAVQLYYVEEGQAIHLYFVDERGSLFHRRIAKMDIQVLIGQYLRFLRSVSARQAMHHAAGDEKAAGKPVIEVFQAHKKYHGKSVLVPHREEPPDSAQHYFNIQVITSVSPANQPEFTIYVDDREFSTLEFGDDLYRRVAAHIIELRKHGQRYPIYITDIDLAHEIVGMTSTDQLQTVHYLAFKKQIEDKLNLALASLLGSRAAGQRG